MKLGEAGGGTKIKVEPKELFRTKGLGRFALLLPLAPHAQQGQGKPQPAAKLLSLALLYF